MARAWRVTLLCRPRAILLDLDGTLLDHENASGKALLEALEATGLGPRVHGAPEAALSRWHSLEVQHFQRYLDGELSFEEQRVIRTREFLESYGVADLDRAATLRWFDRYRAQYQAAWRPFADVHPFLNAVAALERPPALAIVSNGEQAQQEAKLVALGLEGIRLFTSSALGVPKPDPGLFHQVCQALGVRSDEAWFIGDDRDVDAVGAQAAGLHGVWLDRHGIEVAPVPPSPAAWPARTTTLANVLHWIGAAR
ncbi:HAD family hydrolase [Galactobacter caseinivorans]|uniref:HAD family hydrolase n=1 Tax=Galactobacter caseinivorans TaxID=2676123 RepID=A0A496PL80_9MICC|nr:HAD family hydrolase [Galactobacter caseinivorans]RKW71292.1 HAD family hydrolase [Galactobacter caseinivorans]